MTLIAGGDAGEVTGQHASNFCRSSIYMYLQSGLSKCIAMVYIIYVSTYTNLVYSFPIMQVAYNVVTHIAVSTTTADNNRTVGTLLCIRICSQECWSSMVRAMTSWPWSLPRRLEVPGKSFPIIPKTGALTLSLSTGA